jgi:hypothetical protein
MQVLETQTASPARRMRGAGRGGSFCVLDRGHWDRLWQVPTANRLNLVVAFLVLLAGTGADHRLTKWSAKACENHVGMGKPRAQAAIKELIAAELVAHAPASSATFPHYLLAEPASQSEPIFLPVQLVTGFGQETPILRRVRETGDALVLRMLVDLYGLVQVDPSFGVPIARLRKGKPGEESCRRTFEVAPNALWALDLDDALHAAGDWLDYHAVEAKGGKGGPDWSLLWQRIETLQVIGALWFEPWVFDGEELDAEPIFPALARQDFQPDHKRIMELGWLRDNAARKMVGERTYVMENYGGEVLMVLPSHHRRPALRGVARLRVEADTPARRLAYSLRMTFIERQEAAYRQLLAAERLCDTPIRVG